MELVCAFFTFIFTLYGLLYAVTQVFDFFYSICEKISAKFEKQKKQKAEREWNEYVEQCKAERLQRIYKRMSKQMANCSTQRAKF